MEVAGELRLTVVVSVGEQIDEEEEEFAAGATNVGYVVSADITKLTLVPQSDFRSDMVGDLVQNIRFNFMIQFFVL